MIVGGRAEQYEFNSETSLIDRDVCADQKKKQTASLNKSKERTLKSALTARRPVQMHQCRDLESYRSVLQPRRNKPASLRCHFQRATGRVLNSTNRFLGADMDA